MIKKTGKKKFELKFDGRVRNNGLTMDQIRQFNEEKGRIFFGLTKSERKQLTENVAKKINEVIKKLFS
jgi:hypothetical protein